MVKKENKVECIEKCVEKILKSGGKLMRLIEDMHQNDDDDDDDDDVEIFPLKTKYKRY